MDDRSLSWLPLLPPTTTLRPTGLPDGLLRLLARRIDANGETWIAWRPGACDPLLRHPFRAAALINPGKGVLPQLRLAGYSWVRPFAVVPNLRDARWFIPLDSPAAAARGWDLYTPMHYRARISKAVARLATRASVLQHIGDRIVLAQRQAAPLEALFGETLGERSFSVSIASGTPGPRRKVTLQLANSDGAVLAYAKYATGPEVTALLRKEAEFLDYVLRLGLSSVQTPHLLYHGSYGDDYLMLSTPVSRDLRPSGVSLTARHFAILREMAQECGESRVGDRLRLLGQRVAALSASLPPVWQQRFGRAMVVTLNTHGLHALPTTLSHGDFAPWNLRLHRHTNQVALFDWEQGQIDQLPLWDAFHFDTQVNLLVRRSDPATSVQLTLSEMLGSSLTRNLSLSAAQTAALYVGYLMDASVQWFEDHLPLRDSIAAESTEQETRGQMLEVAIDLLRLWQQ